jgi:hypothetical protein
MVNEHSGATFTSALRQGIVVNSVSANLIIVLPGMLVVDLVNYMVAMKRKNYQNG